MIFIPSLRGDHRYHSTHPPHQHHTLCPLPRCFVCLRRLGLRSSLSALRETSDIGLRPNNANLGKSRQPSGRCVPVCVLRFVWSRSYGKPLSPKRGYISNRVDRVHSVLCFGSCSDAYGEKPFACFHGTIVFQPPKEGRYPWRKKGGTLLS